MNDRIEVDEIILQWALRYALNRQTYAGSDVQKAVRENEHKLSRRFIEVAVRDINEAERLANAGLGIDALGDRRIDEPTWLALRDRLERRL